MAPNILICIGMAGSGKTTFMQRLCSKYYSKHEKPYVINLDPAVLKLPYKPNIDIRDSISYKKVIDDYNLGPNGAIVTSLNLFSTKIDQVIKLIEDKGDKIKNVIIDTPGQIECFVWSASGAIITESFASTFPTVIAYIVDVPRTTSPVTFMSNMLYSCSVLYKTKLPLIIVFNKIDVKDSDFAKEWIQDFYAFQMAVKKKQETDGEDDVSTGYMSSLINSMSLVLDEFYSTIDHVSVSSYTGKGFDEFFTLFEKKVDEYNTYYKVDQENIIKKKKEMEEKKKKKDLERLLNDLDIGDKKHKYEDSNVLSDFDTNSDDDQGEVLRSDDDLWDLENHDTSREDDNINN